MPASPAQRDHRDRLSSPQSTLWAGRAGGDAVGCCRDPPFNPLREPYVFPTQRASLNWTKFNEELPDGSGSGPSVRWVAVLPVDTCGPRSKQVSGRACQAPNVNQRGLQDGCVDLPGGAEARLDGALDPGVGEGGVLAMKIFAEAS